LTVGIQAEPTAPTQAFYQPTDSCSSQFPGDANSDGAINRDDAIFLLNYLCHDGPAPEPLPNGDPNGDCLIDSLDIDYLMAAILYGGPAPVACTCLEPATGSCFVDTCGRQHPGDIDGNGLVNIGDAVYLVGFLFQQGPTPNPLANGDVNGDCVIDYADCVCLLRMEIPEFPCRVNCTCVYPLVDTPCGGKINGDANGDGKLTVGDAIYIITHIFRSGPAPTPYAVYSGDPNGDCVVNSGDAVYIVNHIFRSGPAPVGCYTWLGRCGEYVH
jgi:hypothetical protein